MATSEEHCDLKKQIMILINKCTSLYLKKKEKKKGKLTRVKQKRKTKKNSEKKRSKITRYWRGSR